MVTTFLYRFLDEVIYIEQSHFFELNSKLVFELNSKLVFRLCKALYRLKQVSQVCYQTITAFLMMLYLKRLQYNYNIYVF